MIDVQKEQLVTLPEARKIKWLRGRGGRQLDIGTIRRWGSGRGVRGTILETTRIGGTTYTSVEALLRFIDRLNGTPESGPVATKRLGNLRSADQALNEAGIM